MLCALPNHTAGFTCLQRLCKLRNAAVLCRFISWSAGATQDIQKEGPDIGSRLAFCSCVSTLHIEWQTYHRRAHTHAHTHTHTSSSVSVQEQKLYAECCPPAVTLSRHAPGIFDKLVDWQGVKELVRNVDGRQILGHAAEADMPIHLHGVLFVCACVGDLV